MGAEIVTVETDGQTFTAFERVQARASFKEAARSFRLEAAAENGGQVLAGQFRAGAQVTIRANGDLLLIGYVDQYQPCLGAKKAEVTISGRSKSGDLVDCSAVHDSGSFEQKTALDIGNAVASGIGATFETDQQLDPVDYQVTPGESVFRAVEKIARTQGLTITGTPEGNAKITKAGSKRHAAGIFEGINLLSGEADHNWSNRHSKYIVRGQRPKGHGVAALEIEAIAKDAGVNRNRTVIVVQDEDTSKDKARSRAKNRRDRAAGNSLTATISVQGFRDDAGQLWTPGYLIWVESPFLNIAQDMILDAVDWTQDSDGSIAKLSLCDPRSYGGKKGKGNKSGSDWSQSDDDAE